MSTKLTRLFFLLCFTVIFCSLLQAEQTKQNKVIVFDFGGVIAETDKEEVDHFIAQSLHITESEVQKAIAQLKLYTDTDQDKDEKDFWIKYAKEQRINLPQHWMQLLNQERFRALKTIPGMIALVKDLQKQGYQTALLSNVRKNQAAIKRKLGYYELFNPILLSYEIGARKPHRKAYDILLRRLNASPQQVIFIDNKRSNVEAAKSMGMDAINFVDANQLIQELRKRGIEVSLPKSASNS